MPRWRINMVLNSSYNRNRRASALYCPSIDRCNSQGELGSLRQRRASVHHDVGGELLESSQNAFDWPSEMRHVASFSVGMGPGRHVSGRLDLGASSELQCMATNTGDLRAGLASTAEAAQAAVQAYPSPAHAASPMHALIASRRSHRAPSLRRKLTTSGMQSTQNFIRSNTPHSFREGRLAEAAGLHDGRGRC